jgi:hypothetical protein
LRGKDERVDSLPSLLVLSRGWIGFLVRSILAMMGKSGDQRAQLDDRERSGSSEMIRKCHSRLLLHGLLGIANNGTPSRLEEIENSVILPN